MLKNDDKTNNKIESNTIQNGDEIVFVDIKGAENTLMFIK